MDKIYPLVIMGSGALVTIILCFIQAILLESIIMQLQFSVAIVIVFMLTLVLINSTKGGD